MDKQLIGGLAAALGEKTRIEGSMLHAIVQRGDAWLAARVRTDPFAEIFIATRPLDGFTLSIHWGDRWRDPDVGDVMFDNTFGLQTNDQPLMRAFLDGTSRDALMASIYTFSELDALLQPKQVQRTWTYELENDQLVVTKGSRELDVDLFMRAILCGCTLAGRSQRWATEYTEAARLIGGRVAAEVQIGGDPVLTTVRSAVDASVRIVRRTARAERLRTVVAAERIGGEGSLSVVCDQLPKDARPDLPDGDRQPLELGDYRLRASSRDAATKLDELAKKLVGIAQPAVIVMGLDDVEVWFDGAPTEPARLDAAVALVARLAVDAVAARGPYR